MALLAWMQFGRGSIKIITVYVTKLLFQKKHFKGATTDYLSDVIALARTSNTIQIDCLIGCFCFCAN